MFITNTPGQVSLKQRLADLISMSEEIKFLAGFFYFSGWQELTDAIKENPDLKLKILVGLEADEVSGRLVEYGTERLSQEEQKNRYLQSLVKALNHAGFDEGTFYEQLHLFLEWLQNGRMEIRKTLDPNHAKLYLFRLQPNKLNVQHTFITGSSNLSRKGLTDQQEFNIEIHNFGFERAENYFDSLWETSVPIEPQTILETVKRTMWAEVSPFEAFLYILKTYWETLQVQDRSDKLRDLLEEAGFIPYNYQIDAVNQGLKIIDNYGGVIIADVVGLGKSVIASLIANRLRVNRGLILVPPGLIGDSMQRTGWHEYLFKFNLRGDWEIQSLGNLEKFLEEHKNVLDQFDAVIVDEAHRFRNQDTASYEALAHITQGKKVILLTATPFNNSPADIFSLLKLFVVPGQSPLSPADDLQILFRYYKSRFDKAGFITKNYRSDDPDKQKKVRSFYETLTGKEAPKRLTDAHIREIKEIIREVSVQIKEVISPVVIRRNRLDLINDPVYKEEVKNLPKVRDPEEIFFELEEEQLSFYDEIIRDYFGPDGQFRGAVYQPFAYETDPEEEGQDNGENLDQETNRERLSQRNLYDFMRRLLVKRFESSFGSFRKSVERFLKSHEVILKFIEDSGIYFLDKDLIESAYQDDDELTEEKLNEIIRKFQERNANDLRPRRTKIYEIEQFARKEDFLNDIKSDMQLFKQILERLDQLDMIASDPKRKAVLEKVEEILSTEEKPKRKVVIFSEYVDTIAYLEPYFEEYFKGRVLVCKGDLPKDLARKINENFNAQYPAELQKDDYDILLTSDKLSEGVNLNRAGAIINYDIPWNPTRVIQRVGRINRIGKKVFDELFIYNIFPTQRGEDLVKSRQIAAQKMFMIHNALGEDVKIFDPDEEPTPSSLYERINTNPELEDEESFLTRVRKLWFEYKEQYPEEVKKISQWPPRIKTAKMHEEPGLVMVKRKGLSVYSLFAGYSPEAPENGTDIPFEEIEFDRMRQLTECSPEEPRLPFSKKFWPTYEALKTEKLRVPSAPYDTFEQKALNSLRDILRTGGNEIIDLRTFIQVLLDDIQKYKTLPRYTLRKLIINESNPRDQMIRNIRELKEILGENYLDKVKERAGKIKEEVIIAVENQNGL